ncbi:MFS transporter [Rothia uropygioeca]|uniref:MFS transporter n=1 Tax=Kocuria sp. 257 TaxID=2021970 RepID=UPI0013EE2CC2|nr:MFS transporter [Kocuria sp. 257]
MGQSNQKCPVVAIIVYLLAMALNGFDGTVINPALPDLATELSVPAPALGAVEWSFLIASAVTLPMAGWAGATLGTRRTFVCCLAVFATGLLIAMLAPSLEVLVLGRAVQGAGSGILVPVGLAMMYRGATGEQRLRIARITLVPLTIAPMLGPVLGGMIVQHLGWRWIFGVMFPLAVLTTLAALMLLTPARLGSEPDQEPLSPSDNQLKSGSGKPKGKFDVYGLITGCLSCGALAIGGPLLVAGLDPGGPVQVGAVALAAALTLIGALGVFGAVRRTRRVCRPAFDLGLFRLQTYRTGSWIVSCASAGLAGFLFALPLVLGGRGVPPHEIGFMMFPETLGLLVGGQIMLHLKSRFGTRPVVLAGSVGGGFLALAALIFSPIAGGWGAAVLMLCFGVALSQTVLLTQGAAFWEIEAHRTDAATSLFMVQRSLFSGWGVVVVTTAMGWSSGTYPMVSGALAGCAVLLLVLLTIPATLRIPCAVWDRATGPQE